MSVDGEDDWGVHGLGGPVEGAHWLLPGAALRVAHPGHQSEQIFLHCPGNCSRRETSCKSKPRLSLP